MGAEQSSTRDRSTQQEGDGQPAKTCYYEVLGVDRQASEDEVKKAYRRKALELHPDRNYGDVDSATMLFAEVQSAYQVLSDPQERAWYDSHRDSILRNGDVGAEEHFEYNIKLTTAEDIINLVGKFSTRVPFTDAPTGFYGSLRTMFEDLAREEEAACEWNGLEITEYPDFGCADDTHQDVAKPFYSIWMNFATKKTFSWKDEHNQAEAPDRRVRRLMEKENRRVREEAIREFNDAVRSLVSFARKRDHRFTPNTQSDAERQKTLREAAAAQALRSRAAYEAKLNKHVVPAWAQARDPEPEMDEPSDSDSSEDEHFECVTCRKLFKSEKQYEAHERSKKHIKTVQQLKWQMQKENKRLNLDETTSSRPATSLSESESETCDSVDSHQLEAKVYELQRTLGDPSQRVISENRVTIEDTRDFQVVSTNTSQHSSSCEDEADDEYAPRKEVEMRIATNISNEISTIDEEAGLNSPIRDQLVPDLSAISLQTVNSNRENATGDLGHKVGRAKAKREKRAARQETTSQAKFNCATCNESFESKNRLFSHIEDEGHAQPNANTTKGRKGKKRL